MDTTPKNHFAFLVTHGEKEDCPDPGMTPQGMKRVESLRKPLAEFLPNGPSQVHIGLGKRQQEVADALGLEEHSPFYSAVWGGPETETRRGGKSLIMLPNGRLIDWEHYLSTMHLQSAIFQAITGLPDGAVICSGRPVLIRLGMALTDQCCQSGALYTIRFTPGDPDSIEVELKVTGVNLGDDKGAAV